jgi:hypothetical protein
MRRHVVLIISLFYLFGTVGIPVVAYSCVESGEVGVVAYLSGSHGSCYVDSCCDGDQDPPNVSIQSDIGCCYFNIQVAPENSRILLPGPKNGLGEPLPKALARFDASLPDICVVSAQPSISAFHTPINLPLLI